MADSPKKSRSLAGIAGIVALATLISKVFGLVREQAIARAFGVRPVVDAYAYIILGFLLILLGGINGPFHFSKDSF
ncbi:integral membrane protein MviN [[Leptolyngbya] sp. PCC 7376]|nr:integral membrane protein MviN [[Leptolyngbya] sp. PCC 7376]